MDCHNSHRSLTAALLRHLESEEALLRTALSNVTGLNDALMRGDLTSGRTICTGQPALADALHDAAEARGAAAAALALELGLAPAGVTLAALAEQLPPDLQAEILAARTRLTALTSELTAIQARNANLTAHLRSFFRGVLSEVTAADAPPRYGPTGRRI